MLTAIVDGDISIVLEDVSRRLPVDLVKLVESNIFLDTSRVSLVRHGREYCKRKLFIYFVQQNG